MHVYVLSDSQRTIETLLFHNHIISNFRVHINPSISTVLHCRKKKTASKHFNQRLLTLPTGQVLTIGLLRACLSIAIE